MNHRPKRVLKAAFVVVTSGVAVGSAACGPETSVNPPFVETDCDETPPTSGSPCDDVGMACDYGDTGCGPLSATCTVDGWEISGTQICNPPPPACPESPPTLGEACEAQPDTLGTYPFGCVYPVETPCGEQTVTMGCEPDAIDGTQRWAITGSAPQCDVTPDACHTYADPSQCDADPGCQFLVAGCAEGTQIPVETGCYPMGDCASVGCDTWGSCVTAVHDPCAGSNCDACGAEIDVCVASATP